MACAVVASLTVALPVVSATGVECSCIPTALLSTHTGEFTGWTRRDLTDQMLPIARHWHQLGIRLDGVHSGYLASPAQERVLEDCPWVLLHYAKDFSLVNERVLNYLPHNFPYGMQKHYRVRRR